MREMDLIPQVSRYEGPCEIASSICFEVTIRVDYASRLLFT